MLDYSLDKESAKTFVLSYDPLGENLKVNIANGDDYTVPNTKENKQSLIEKMEEQVNDSWEFKAKQEKRKKSAIGWLIYDSAFIVFNIISLCFNPGFLPAFCISLFLLSGVGQILTLKDAKNKLKDVEKNELFLNNKTSINNYLEKGNDEVKEDTMVPVKEEKEPILTINDVHDMSYNDVDRIVTDIRRDQKLGIDRPKVLVKQYLKK